MSTGLRQYRLLDSKPLNISIGLRPYRLFDSKFQHACGNIAFVYARNCILLSIEYFSQESYEVMACLKLLQFVVSVRLPSCR